MRFMTSCVLMLLLAGATAWTAGEGGWDPKAAASYLDGRANWWVAWPSAARDHETFCISCHTGMPYAIARPALRAALGERQPTAAEAKMLDVVAKRVALWKDVDPWYPDQTRGIPKTSESRGTEAVINALVLGPISARRWPSSQLGRRRTAMPPIHPFRRISSCCAPTPSARSSTSLC
ncbi:MAG: hypothetical protein AUI11_09635 [Acidobacteria bacterium 13_2_20CM_2_66_4]|nr:MAG: hypothetical protein AUI11_09635 [Acidobacteria bacterium 13_2_20CM_2_66_4]